MEAAKHAEAQRNLRGTCQLLFHSHNSAAWELTAAQQMALGNSMWLKSADVLAEVVKLHLALIR